MMRYRFIILLGERDADSDMEARLQRLGLSCRLSARRLTVYASSTTPTVAITDGIIIGHVFSKQGVAVGDVLPDQSKSPRLLQHLIQNLWGDYIALQLTDEGDEQKASVLREPSGAIPCVYAVTDGTGFVTSDVSIAVDLGLYQRAVDWEFVTHWLVHPYLRTERTALSGLRELPPGCSLMLTSHSHEIRSCWSPWRFVSEHERYRDRAQAVSEVRSAVMAAVRAWADVDRSVVLELSGGLDSSIVSVCLAGTSCQAVGAHLKLTQAAR